MSQVRDVYKRQDFDYGRVLAEKMGALAHTFEMGKYSECSTMLDVVYAEKNVEVLFLSLIHI